MTEPRREEVIHSITFGEEETIDTSPKLEGVNLDDNRAIADYYMAKNNLITEEELEVERKEKELLNDIREVLDDPDSLAKYLTNLHASIEVMEERICELELKAERRERASLPRPTPPRGLAAGSLPFGVL